MQVARTVGPGLQEASTGLAVPVRAASKALARESEQGLAESRSQGLLAEPVPEAAGWSVGIFDDIGADRLSAALAESTPASKVVARMITNAH